MRVQLESMVCEQGRALLLTPCREIPFKILSIAVVISRGQGGPARGSDEPGHDAWAQEPLVGARGAFGFGLRSLSQARRLWRCGVTKALEPFPTSLHPCFRHAPPGPGQLVPHGAGSDGPEKPGHDDKCPVLPGSDRNAL